MAYYSRAHICQCLTRLSTYRRNAVVTVTGNRVKTGEMFVEEVMDLSRGLLELGIRPGDVVAICAFNSDWYLQWLLAIAFVGGIVAPLNYRWSFQEAHSAMSKVQPVMLVSDESCNSWYSILCSQPIASLKWNVVIGSTSLKCKNSFKTLAMETLMKSTKEPLLLNYSWAPEAPAIICFTSGTTGRPKGVMISHSALVVQSLAKVAIVGYSEDDIYLHTTPLCHIGGLSSAMAMLMVGACHILTTKFEAIIAVDAIEKHNVTSFITVPAIMSDLISLTRDKETWKGKQSVAKLLNGGGSLSEKLIKDVRKCFPRARLLSAYGTTEACSSLTFMCLHDPLQYNFGQTQQILVNTRSSNQSQGVCVGKPAPHVELKICSDGSSHIGRILTRGPHLMLRYWDESPENSSDTNIAWLDTGDIGCTDDSSNLWLVGRANGRIKSGGENVYPEEVESILSQHAGIFAAVVVGIPDTRLSEMVVACIKLRENWEWSDSSGKPIAENKQVLCSYSLSTYCKAKNLTGFKIPKKFLLWKKPFPLTTTGKIMRDQVRTEVGSHLQSLLSSL